MTKHVASDDAYQFEGFRSPKYTQVPDELFDDLLVRLSGAELKILLYIIRRTFGFKQDADTISLSQMLGGIVTRAGERLDYGTGLSKPTLLLALRSLQAKGIVLTERRRSSERGDEPTVYRLRFAGEPARDHKVTPPVVKKFDQGGGQKTLPGPWSKNLTTQHTDRQETEIQETALLSKTPDIRPSLSILAIQHNDVDNFADGAEMKHGGRPTGLRPVKTGQPPPPSSRHGIPNSAHDPTGREAQVAAEPLRPTATRRGKGAARIAGDDQAAAETHARSAGREGFSSMDQLLAGRDQRRDHHPVAVQREEDAETPRKGSAGAEIADQGHTPSESHRDAAATPSRWRQRVTPPPYIANVINDFSSELHDAEHTRANLTRATRLWQRSGLDEAVFVTEVLYKARAITRAQPGVTKRSAAGGLVNKMPYYFAVVEGMLGLRGAPGQRQSHEARVGGS